MYKAMNAVIQLFRPVTSFMAGLAVFVAAFIGAGLDIGIYASSVILAIIVAFFFTSAGSTLNDYFDRDIDLINHPERPIPSGRIKPRQALVLSVIIFSIVIVLAWFINVICFFIVLLELLFVVNYEKFLKNKGLAGNLVISTQTALAFVFGGAAVNKIEITIILALLAFFSILGREIVKDIEDIKGDVNRHTLPIKIGGKNAGIIAIFFVCIAIVMSPLPYHPLGIFNLLYIPLITIADLVLIFSFPFISKNPKLARKILKVGMLSAIFAFIIGGITSS